MDQEQGSSSATISCYDCSMCNFSAPGRKLWLSHLRGVHSEDEDFHVVCKIDGCTTEYTKCSSLVSHVYRKHRDVLAESNSLANDDTDSVEKSYDGNECFSDTMPNIELEHTISHLLGTDEELQKEKAALYILNLKEIHGLSESAVQHVVGETQAVFSHTFKRMKAGVGEHLSRSGIDVPQSLSEMFASVMDPFQGLSTTHLQEKYYREHFKCIVSYSAFNL